MNMETIKFPKIYRADDPHSTAMIIGFFGYSF